MSATLLSFYVLLNAKRMKKNVRLICSLLVCAFATTVQAQKEVKFQNSQARLLDITTNAYVKPMIVEFEPLSVSEATTIANKLNAAGDGREYKVTGRTSETEKGKNKARVEAVIRMSLAQVESLKNPVTGSVEVSEIRKWGTFQVAKAFDADVLLGPLFDVKTADAGGFYELTVIGYPARFVNWRDIRNDDYMWINVEKSTGKSDSEKTKAIMK